MTLGFIICADAGSDSMKLIFAGISASVAAMAGYVINDLFDIEIDRINRPERALPGNKMSLRGAVILYILLLAAAHVAAIPVGFTAILIVAAASFLLYLYSWRLKKALLAGNISIGLLTAIAVVYGGYAAGNPSGACIPAIFAFIVNLMREIVKDIEDLEGDRIVNVITYPEKFGIKSTLNLVSWLGIILVMLTLLPWLFSIYNIYYLVIIIMPVDLLFIYIIITLNKDQTDKSLNKISFLLKLNMLFGMAAVYTGTII